MTRSREATRRAARLLAILFCAMAFFGPLLGPAVLAGAQAHAQAAAGQADPHAGHDHAAPGHAAPAAAAHGAGMDQPVLNQQDRSGAIMFWLFALMSVGGSIFVITRRNLISAVMGMVGTFFAIAAIYAMLYAHFLAAIQVLVYAGAIMVLFVFVIMILNKPEDEPWRPVGAVGKGVSVALVGYLVGRLIQVLWSFSPDPASVRAPQDIPIPVGTEVEMAGFGSTMAVGHNLFTHYLFPFEAVSLVLLIAIVGAIAVARPHEKPPSAISPDQSPSA